MKHCLPIGHVGRTVIRKQTSCLRKFSHSALISLRTLKFTVTSALTLEGFFSPDKKKIIQFVKPTIMIYT